MDIRKLVETQSAQEEAPGTSSGARTEAVKLVEMGDVSVETRGIARGLELGYTPKS